MSMLDFVDCLGSSQGAVASFCVFMPFLLIGYFVCGVYFLIFNTIVFTYQKNKNRSSLFYICVIPRTVCLRSLGWVAIFPGIRI